MLPMVGENVAPGMLTMAKNTISDTATDMEERVVDCSPSWLGKIIRDVGGVTGMTYGSFFFLIVALYTTAVYTLFSVVYQVLFYLTIGFVTWFWVPWMVLQLMISQWVGYIAAKRTVPGIAEKVISTKEQFVF